MLKRLSGNSGPREVAAVDHGVNRIDAQATSFDADVQPGIHENPETNTQRVNTLRSNLARISLSFSRMSSDKKAKNEGLETGKVRHAMDVQDVIDGQHPAGDGYYIDRLRMELKEYNLGLDMNNCYLSSGQHSYFNDQVDEKGISSLRLDPQDKDDAAYISKYFSKISTYGENDISVVYTTLLGTTEIDYATNSLPAGIAEDVFQIGSDRFTPIRPRVGEAEVEYYCRVMQHNLDSRPDLSEQTKAEIMLRSKRLAQAFCVNEKNRIYLIPLHSVMENRASFGDVVGLREGVASVDSSSYTSLNTLATLIDRSVVYPSTEDLYHNPNFTSEFGVAIYGAVPREGLSYVEVDKLYNMIQDHAKENGLADGEDISVEIERLFRW